MLSRRETVVLLALLGSVALVYIAAAGICVRRLADMVRRRRRTPSRRVVWTRRVILTLALVGVLCIGYAWAIEPYWLDVSHVRLTSSKITGRPLRIVHISDLHCDARPRLETRLPSIVADLQPDLICFTGDSINNGDGLGVFRELMSQLSRIAPVYAARGNWDYRPPTNVFDGTDVMELDGRVANLELAGSRVWISGNSFGRRHAAGATAAAAPADAYAILLQHVPSEVLLTTGTNLDLFLAGHTHGGQIALPFYGAVVTLTQHGKRFERGLIRVDSVWLHVSRGIGMEGSRAPRMRFLARPEVTLIEIAGDRGELTQQ